MKIAVISTFPPSVDNYKGPSGLPYSLLACVPDRSEVHLFYYPYYREHAPIYKADIARLNLAEVVEIGVPSRLSRWSHERSVRRRGLPGAVASYPAQSSIVRRIRKLSPDVVWLYPYWLISWAEALADLRVVVTGPDCASLHYHRALGDVGNPAVDQHAYARDLLAYQRLEQAWRDTAAAVHMVGECDRASFERDGSTPSHLRFIPYPLPMEHRARLNHASGKLTVMFSGGGETVYVGDHLTRVTNALVSKAALLRESFQFYMLGTGYGASAQHLRSAGYEVTLNEWVRNYSEVVASAEIQIFPIAVGTGTKGKVLVALASGVITIGSRFAYENILVGEERLPYVYDRPEQVVDYLCQIMNDPDRAFATAVDARGDVLVTHSPQAIGVDFWNWAATGQVATC